MPGKFESLIRVKAVEREYKATRLAMDFLVAAVYRDPTLLGNEVRARDLNEADTGLEGTYTIRLFAEFETCLRTFWSSARVRRAPSRVKDLLDGVAARRGIPHDTIQLTHAVRDYRNSLVHERDDAPAAIAIDEARHRLCHFLSFLPIEW